MYNIYMHVLSSGLVAKPVSPGLAIKFMLGQLVCKLVLAGVSNSLLQGEIGRSFAVEAQVPLMFMCHSFDLKFGDPELLTMCLPCTYSILDLVQCVIISRQVTLLHTVDGQAFQGVAILLVSSSCGIEFAAWIYLYFITEDLTIKQDMGKHILSYTILCVPCQTVLWTTSLEKFKPRIW